MQTANVSQPIEYAVGLSSLCFNLVYRMKGSICKVPVNILWFLKIKAEEISLLLLTVLEPVSLILDRVSIDLNLLPLSIGITDSKSLRMNFRLFDHSLFPKFLQVKTFLVV